MVEQRTENPCVGGSNPPLPNRERCFCGAVTHRWQKNGIRQARARPQTRACLDGAAHRGLGDPNGGAAPVPPVAREVGWVPGPSRSEGRQVPIYREWGTDCLQRMRQRRSSVPHPFQLERMGHPRNPGLRFRNRSITAQAQPLRWRSTAFPGSSPPPPPMEAGHPAVPPARGDYRGVSGWSPIRKLHSSDPPPAPPSQGGGPGTHAKHELGHGGDDDIPSGLCPRSSPRPPRPTGRAHRCCSPRHCMLCSPYVV